MPTMTAAPGKLHDAGVDVSAEKLDNLRPYDEVFVSYWSYNPKDERPERPLSGTFQAISDWEPHGYKSKRVLGNLIGDHLTKRAHLIVTPIPPPEKKKRGRSSNAEPKVRISLYIAQ